MVQNVQIIKTFSDGSFLTRAKQKVKSDLRNRDFRGVPRFFGAKLKVSVKFQYSGSKILVKIRFKLFTSNVSRKYQTYCFG